MKPVMQKITDGVTGDCFGACVASILELEDDYPNFHRKDRGPWIDQWNDYLKPWGLELLYIPGGHPPPNGLAIMAVKSVNFLGFEHSVVWQGDGRGGGSIVHDPSPLKKVEDAEPIGWFAFGVLDPVKMLKWRLAMFVDAHFECDRAGCNNRSPATRESVPEPTSDQIWYRLIVQNSKGTRRYDFCSLECLAVRIRARDLDGL